jgi:hypothetical protein
LIPIFFAQHFVGKSSLSMEGGVFSTSPKVLLLQDRVMPDLASTGFAVMQLGPWRSKKEIAGTHPPPTRTWRVSCEMRHRIFFPEGPPIRYAPVFSFTKTQFGY